ncbi:hypothetical protein Y032_0007g3567 [Ancylostoma ceylanicum]|uniref:Uncharacterized protein n=1 Tax=Ancylostoma ceylanicum TaxID=53326 RepID=A0A016VNV8_9BILA|nr:hypothetical protein Y032_0007g3567 [Ancylostoma ceylanicum]
MRRVKTLAASPSAPRFNCWFAAQAFVLVASNEGKIEQLGGDAATVPIRRTYYAVLAALHSYQRSSKLM